MKYEMTDYDTSPLSASNCRKLWITVLLTALQDMAGRAHNSVDKDLAQRRASAWFGTNNFRTVCHLAGFEPEFIRDNKDRILRSLSAEKKSGRQRR